MRGPLPEANSLQAKDLAYLKWAVISGVPEGKYLAGIQEELWSG
jgi:hypothetical protein